MCRLSEKVMRLTKMAAIRTERHMRVVCIAAGASDLCFAYKLQQSFEKFSPTIYSGYSRSMKA